MSKFEDLEKYTMLKNSEMIRMQLMLIMKVTIAQNSQTHHWLGKMFKQLLDSKHNPSASKFEMFPLFYI